MIFYQASNSRSCEHHDINLFTDFVFLSHMHRDLEIIYLLEGEIDLQVEMQTWRLHAGQTALIFTNQIHAYSNPASCKMLVHVFSPDTVRSFTREIGTKVGTTPIFECDQAIKDYYYECCVNKEYRSPLALKSYLYAICDQYLRTTELIENTVQDSDIIHSILNYISEHYTEDISLSGIADEFGYEPHYLSRIFTKTVKINLKQYINQYRIDCAKDYLLQTKKNITDIALLCGFQSVRNFNRVFKEFEKMTPGQFVNISRK